MKLSLKDQLMSPLQFWFNNLYQFPKLYRVVSRILTAPATSCASERCFSIAGYTISDR